MDRTPRRMTPLAVLLLVSHPVIAAGQRPALWLDQGKPPSWNVARAPIPAAPKIEGAPDPRCRSQARPAHTEEDRRVRARGWDLLGAYQGGWQMLVVQGAAGYDGMCRPRMYHAFVFVRGVFAGTLSPRPMESRSDGALSRVALADKRITAEYLRYASGDPLCCASSTAFVVFDVTSAPVVVPGVVTHAGASTAVPSP